MSKKISFGKYPDVIEVPNLLKNQMDSFDDFLNKGIHEILKNSFPIQDYTGDYELQYVSSTVGKPPITPEEALEKNASYSVPIRGVFRLYKHKIGHFLESEVFLGDMPIMTEEGRFVYGGNKRVVVTQIVRSPGVYFSTEKNKNGKLLYKARIIPSLGAWCDFLIDQKGVLHCEIDRGKKLPATVLLKALGFGTNEEILAYFDNSEIIQNTLEKDPTETEEEAIAMLYRQLKPNEGVVVEKAKKHILDMFFSPEKYELRSWGRYKLNDKLNLKQRVLRKRLGKDYGSFKKGQIITDEELDNIEGNELYVDNKGEEVVKVIGNGTPDHLALTKDDFAATINYLISLEKGIGELDNIDHLANRRFRLVGELLENQYRIGIEKLKRFIREKMTSSQTSNFMKGKQNTTEEKEEENEEKVIDQLTPEMLINIRPLIATMKEFFGGSQLSQFVDEINPLAELTNKKRTSALGPGGFVKERAGMEVRDVHYSHYGNICPIETPEGYGVGLIGTTTLYAKINDFGFVETPYMKVDKKTGKALPNEIHYLSPAISEKYYIAPRKEVNANWDFESENVMIRYGKEYLEVTPTEVDYVDVSTKQLVGVGAALIPCLENDDANRALMGANMQRQAVPQIAPEEPFISTGIEGKVAQDTGSSYVARENGKVVQVEPNKVVVRYETTGEHTYKLHRMERTNATTTFNHRVRVYPGQELKKGDVIADSYSSNNGELALGRNLVVAFMPCKGYNFEDAIVLNKRLVKEDAFTTIMLTEYKIEKRETKLGNEEFTLDIPNTGEKAKFHLDKEGIIKIGTYVKSDDILVGKTTPKSQEETSAHERLLRAIFNEKPADVKDNSLKMPNGKQGYIVKIVRNTKEKDPNVQLQNSVIEEIKITIAEKRKITEGDKMAGRHGNKGVIAKILPEEDMPFLPDGTPVDVVLNPLGVPSRMNLGQILETHLGIVAKTLDVQFVTPVFDGPTEHDVFEQLENANLPKSGKFDLYDGVTGEKFENPVTVGVMYMLKLNHQVKDKIHARSTGPYSLVTQQPLGGKAQMGGQRLGEMEVWALEAYGAAYTLQEMVTVKSDDLLGRTEVYNAIVTNQNMPEPRVGEAFPVLLNEIRGLGLNIDAIYKDGSSILKKKEKNSNEE